MLRGEIWRVSLDPAAGVEQQGTRPVLIVSPDVFNRATRCPIVVPITNGGNFARVRGFAVELPAEGLQTTGIVRCDQPRAMDLGDRNATRIEAIPANILADVLAKIRTLL